MASPRPNGEGGRGGGGRGGNCGGWRGEGSAGTDGQAAGRTDRPQRSEDGQAAPRTDRAKRGEGKRAGASRSAAEGRTPTLSTRPKAACPIHLYTGGKGRGFAKFTPVILYGGRAAAIPPHIVFTFVNIPFTNVNTDILSVYICKPRGGLRPPRGRSGSGGGRGESGQLRPANAP